MLYVIGLVAAMGYMYLKSTVIQTNIHTQVKEFHAQQRDEPHDHPPDATYNEVRTAWSHGAKKGVESTHHLMSPKEAKELKVAEAELLSEAKSYDSVGGSAHVEIQGVHLDMANRH